MTAYNFDDSNIQWSTLEGIEHLAYSILDIDEKNKIVDVLFKLEPNRQIVLHRHMAVNHSFVIQGEHRLFEPNGELKEIRAVGSYTTSPASEESHRECGGEDGAVVLFSIRGSDGVFYEVLDDQKNLVAALGMQDFVDLFEANKKKQ